jgi:hypothetical protein
MKRKTPGVPKMTISTNQRYRHPNMRFSRAILRRKEKLKSHFHDWCLICRLQQKTLRMS